MTGRLSPSVSKLTEKAKALLAADPKLSRAAAAREVGLAPRTLGYRLDSMPSDPPDLTDGLSEDPGKSEIPVFERHYEHLSSLRAYPIGDLHIGAKEHAGEALDSWLDYLLTQENVSVVNTGDNTNCALKNAASEAYDDRLTVGEAREQQTQKFSRIKDLIDIIIDGNHENRVYRATGDSPNAAVAAALGINYTRAAALIRYFVGDQRYDLFLRHGTGGGKKIGGAVNGLQDQENIIDADIYVSGHTHTQVAFVKDLFVPKPDSAEVERKKRLFVCSASFVGYEEYAAYAGYAPAHIGAPRIFMDGRRKDAHASV